MDPQLAVSVPPGSERKRYRTLALVALSHAASHAYSALMPIVYPFIMAEYGLNYAQLGFITGLGNTLMSLLQGVFAFVMHKVPRRVLLAAGNFLMAVSTALMPLFGGFVPFFGFNVLARISSSPQHPVGNSLVAENFGKKLRGTAFAINFAGGNAGTLLVPALGTVGVAMLGWRSTLGIFAVIALAVGMLSLAIPEKRLPLRRLAPDERGARAAGRAWLTPLKDKNIRRVVTAAVVAAGGRGIGIVMVYIPLYLQQVLHLNRVEYASLFTIMMIGSVVGPVLVGRISDSIGRKRMATLTYALSAVATLLLLLAGARMVYLIPAISFLGLVVYSQSSQIQALLADVSTAGIRDMAYSAFFTISYLAGGVWSFALGLVIDKFGFTSAFVLMAISYIAGIIALYPVANKQ